jgi:hypothetical protein
MDLAQAFARRSADFSPQQILVEKNLSLRGGAKILGYAQ